MVLSVDQIRIDKKTIQKPDVEPRFKRERYRFRHTRIQSKKDLTIIKVAESFLIKTPPTVNGAISQKEKYHGVIILFLLQ